VNRHLLPDEIDQLLDGEVGFETANLKGHVRSCDQCRAELESARLLVRDLGHLPRLAPSRDFSDKVMAQVQLFTPWHVALGDSLRALVPESRRWRIAALAGLATGGAFVTAIAVFALIRLDAVLFVGELVWDRLRDGAMGALSSGVAALLGDGAAEAFKASGVVGVFVLLASVTVTVLVAAGALRAVAARARAR